MPLSPDSAASFRRWDRVPDSWYKPAIPQADLDLHFAYVIDTACYLQITENMMYTETLLEEERISNAKRPRNSFQERCLRPVGRGHFPRAVAVDFRRIKGGLIILHL